MKNITQFLNNTTLTAGQQILVSIISAFIMIILTPILIKIYALIKGSIVKMLKPAKEKYQRYRRFKNGKLNVNDYIEIQKKTESGQPLNKWEKEVYSRINKNPLKNVLSDELYEKIRNIKIPKSL